MSYDTPEYKDTDVPYAKAILRPNAVGFPWCSKKLLREGLERNDGRVYKLADEWGCTAMTIYRWMDKHGIDAHEGGDGQ